MFATVFAGPLASTTLISGPTTLNVWMMASEPSGNVPTTCDSVYR
jgi:hypothetical protein